MVDPGCLPPETWRFKFKRVHHDARVRLVQPLLVCGKIIRHLFHGSLYAFSSSEKRKPSSLQIALPRAELSFQFGCRGTKPFQFLNFEYPIFHLNWFSTKTRKIRYRLLLITCDLRVSCALLVKIIGDTSIKKYAFFIEPFA